MSFMTPVDTVEEDASDLQFPKAKEIKSRSIHCVQPDESTQFQNIEYDFEIFQQKLSEAGASKENGINSLSNVKKCQYCKMMLKEPYIKCAVCVNLEICLTCFASGREIDAHLNSHDYIIQRDNMQVFATAHKWTAREERILLSTLETHGYGNWEAVSRALLWTHSAAACKQHYHNCYFGGIFEKLLNLPHARDTYFPETQPYIAKMRSVDPPRHDDLTSVQFKMMSGYRAARGDFDMPFDQSAESLISIIQQSEEELTVGQYQELTTQQRQEWAGVENELKCAILHAYNHRLW